jgi:hypothetical protein
LCPFFAANPPERVLQAGAFLFIVAGSFQAILKGPSPDPKRISESERKKTTQTHRFCILS